jgi:HEAT repeat protein
MVVVLTLLGGCLLSATLWAGEAKPANVDEVLKQVATYEYGQSRAPLIALETLLRESYKEPEQRKQIVARLVALLDSKATTDAQRFVLRQLSIVGGPEVVPALAKRLPDKDLSHLARMGLERIPGEEASSALRAFLDQGKGDLLIGAINSLGERGDAKAAGPLAKLLGSPDAAVASAAAVALGKIGSPDATRALAEARPKASEKLQPVLTGAYLACAERLVAEGKKDQAVAIYTALYKPAEPRLVRIAALRGLVAAQGEKAVPLVGAALMGEDAEMKAIATSFVREVPGEGATKAFAALLAKMEPAGQALLLAALADRGDPAARPEVLAATKSKDQAVRVAAFAALATLGDASTVALLARTAAAGGPEANAARDSLYRLRGDGVDKAILALMADADVRLRVTAIQGLAARRVAQAVPALLKSAGDADASVRGESLKALGALGDAATLPPLVKLLVQAKDNGDRQAAERAVQAVCSRTQDAEQGAAPLLAALPGASAPACCALLRLLGRLGGPKALEQARAALKDPDAQVQEAALRALAEWPDPAPAADLLALAKGAEKPNHRILALRGYIRAIGLPAKRPALQTLAMYKEAMAAATRVEEKKLVLAGVADVRHADALAMVVPALDEKALAAEAAAAAVKIADAVRGSHADAARAALEKVLQVATDKRLRGQAQGVLKKIPQKK